MAEEKIILNGTESLSIITYTSEGRQEKEYPLVEVTEEVLLKHRASKSPGFVLKKSGRLYYTEIPDISFIAFKLLGRGHRCSKNGGVCKYLSTDEDGCQKVKDPSVRFNLQAGYRRRKAVELADRIEKYNFITEGYETFNTYQDVLYVSNCYRYMEEPKVPSNDRSSSRFYY